MNHLKGEALKVGSDGGIKLEFHGAKVIPLSGITGKKDNGKKSRARGRQRVQIR